jgi:hypothetical protein
LEDENRATKHASFQWLAAAVAVAIVLLFVATLHLPHWYYQLLRWLVCPVFLSSWFWTHSDKNIQTLAFAVGLPYLTFFTIREERRARVQMSHFPLSPAPPVQRSLLSSSGVRASGVSGPWSRRVRSLFQCLRKARAVLLGLKPGEPVPPLNSKAQRRIQP